MPLSLQLPRNMGIPTSWNAAAESVRENPATRDAVEYFRRVLGERWRGWQQHSHLARSFHTSFQGGAREWVRLHLLTIALDGLDNVNLLVKDLGSPAWQKHVAAAQALEFCGRMRAAGHRVEIIQNTDEVSPDVRVWLHERPITLEFKALHDPDEQIRWDNFIDALHNELCQRRPCAEVFPFEAEFSDPALEHLHDVADALSAIAANGNAELHDLPHGAGRARFLADANAPRVLHFPVEQSDDLDRIVGNLGGKYSRQLRSVAGPTLLVVLTKRMFFARFERVVDVARDAASTLQRALAERTMISGLLLHEEPFEPPSTPLLYADRGWRLAMCTTEGRVRTALLVENAAANIVLTEHELDVLVGENMHW